MKLLIVKSLEETVYLDCPYNEYKSIFNWLKMEKGKEWVEELYCNKMIYLLVNSETSTELYLKEKAPYFDNPDFNWFFIVTEVTGEAAGNLAQILITVVQVAVVIAGDVLTVLFPPAGLAILGASIVINLGLSYLSYRLSPHIHIGTTAAGITSTSRLSKIFFTSSDNPSFCQFSVLGPIPSPSGKIIGNNKIFNI